MKATNTKQERAQARAEWRAANKAIDAMVRKLKAKGALISDEIITNSQTLPNEHMRTSN